MRITGRPHVLPEHLDDMRDMRVTVSTAPGFRYTGDLLGVARTAATDDPNQAVILLLPDGDMLMVPIDTVVDVAAAGR